MRSRLVCLALAAALAGCASVPLATMVKLVRLDPLTMEAEGLAVAVSARAPLGLREAGAVLTLGATGPGGVRVEESFTLAAETGGLLPPELQAERRAGWSLAVYRIAPEDVARLEAARDAIRAMKAADPDGTAGSLAVRAAPCRTGPLPEGALPVSTFLRITARDEFLPLTRAADFRDVLAGLGDTAEGLPPCG